MKPTGSAEPTGAPNTVEHELVRHRVQLLDGFALWCDEVLAEIPAQSERLIALLTVHRRIQSRRHVAAELWPESSPKRSSANLRSALWHVRKRCPTLITTSRQRLDLSTTVEADLWRVDDWCDLIRAGQTPTMPIKLGPIDVGELLPSWSDEWLVLPRERHRLHWLQALEDFATRCLDRGDTELALETGLNVIAADPLRESAHYLVISSFRAQGNRARAIQSYSDLTDLLETELGVAPARQLDELLA